MRRGTCLDNMVLSPGEGELHCKAVVLRWLLFNPFYSTVTPLLNALMYIRMRAHNIARQQ